MLNDMLQIYLLMNDKSLNLKIEIPKKTILSFLKILPSPCNCYMLADHIFRNLRFFNKDLGNHKQMSGSECKLPKTMLFEFFIFALEGYFSKNRPIGPY